MTDSIARITSHLQALVGERHPLTAPARLLETEAYLVGQFQQFGLAVTSHGVAAFGAAHRNVIATAPAEDSDLPVLIVGAHLDTVAGSPGADDNASGLVVLLEVAHRLRQIPLSRPVRFIAFALEEHNLLGSQAYVTHLRDHAQTVMGAIVLECVGYADSKDGSQQVPPRVPVKVPTVGDFLAIVGNEPSHALVAAIQRAASRPEHSLNTVPLVVPGDGTSLPDTKRSDHAAFWDAGYPAVMLTDTANYRNPHYHQPTDTIETLDLRFLERVVAVVTRSVVDLAGRPL